MKKPIVKKRNQSDHADWNVPACIHPEHNPPTHMVYPRGKYRHVCPGCRHETVFVVSGAVW